MRGVVCGVGVLRALLELRAETGCVLLREEGMQNARMGAGWWECGC